jgi:hypothetical protein
VCKQEDAARQEEASGLYWKELMRSFEETVLSVLEKAYVSSDLWLLYCSDLRPPSFAHGLRNEII